MRTGNATEIIGVPSPEPEACLHCGLADSERVFGVYPLLRAARAVQGA